MSEIITTAIEAVRSAGKFLLENFGRINSIECKGDRNLVTDIDKKAEAIILEKIRNRFPQHGILGE